jgi:two-component system, chemotaxis family, chemotaxis protein CheY
MLHRPPMSQSDAKALADTATTGEDDMPRLLVIDDDTVHRMIICRVAAKIGYVPVEATSYDDAARLLRERAYDCISLDLSLGRRGGVDVLRLIAELDCKTPIIIVSGSDPNVRAEAMDVAVRLALNAYEPLPKPLNLGDLKQSLVNIKLRTTAGLQAVKGT